MRQQLLTQKTIYQKNLTSPYFFIKLNSIFKIRRLHKLKLQNLWLTKHTKYKMLLTQNLEYKENKMRTKNLLQQLTELAKKMWLTHKQKVL